MELIIVHKKPETTFLTGKWTTNSSIILYYVEVEQKRKEATLMGDVINYIKTITIENSTHTGMYDKMSDAIIYTLSLSEHNMVMEEISKFDNLYIVKFK